MLVGRKDSGKECSADIPRWQPESALIAGEIVLSLRRRWRRGLPPAAGWVSVLLAAAMAPCAGESGRLEAWDTTEVTTLQGSRTTLKQTGQDKALLLFVWNDASPTCVAELCEFWSLWMALKKSNPDSASRFRAATMAAIWPEPSSDRTKVEEGMENAKSRVWKIVRGQTVPGGLKAGEGVTIEGCAIDETQMTCFLDREAVFTSALFNQLGMGKGQKTLPLAVCFSPDGTVSKDGKRAAVGEPLAKWFRRSTGGQPLSERPQGASPPSPPMPDDCRSSQYALYVSSVVFAKVMNVDENGKFNPAGKMSPAEWAMVLARLGAAAERVEGLKTSQEPMTRARALVWLMRALLAGSEVCAIAPETEAKTISSSMALLRRLPLACKDVEALERLAKEQGGDDCLRRLLQVCRDKVEHLRGAYRIPDWALCYYAKAFDMGLLDESPNLKPDEPLTRDYGAFLAAHFLRISGTYTGLVIDCSRYVLDRVAAASIECEDGTVLYPFKPQGVGTLDPARGFGTVGYYARVDDAKKVRGRYNPLVVLASDVVGTKGTMPACVDSVIVSRRAKEQILLENEKSGFLQNWAVAFVVTPLEAKAEYPKPNVLDASVSRPMTISINKAVVTEASEVRKYCQLLEANPDGSEQPRGVQVSYDAARGMLTIRPVERLKPGCSYSLVLKRGLLAFGATAGGKKVDSMLSDEFPLRFVTATHIRGEVVFRLPPSERGKEIILYDEAGEQERFRAAIDAQGTARLIVPAGIYLYRVGTTSSYVEVPQEDTIVIDLMGGGRGG
jgi:hypothetical protein